MEAKLSSRVEQQIISWLKQHDISGEFEHGHSPQQITELSSRAANRDFKTIVAIGDDRSLLACINGVLESGKDPAVGYIPLVRGTFAAQSLDIPNWKVAAQNLIGRKLADYKLAKRPHGYIIFKENLVTKESSSNPIVIELNKNLKIKTDANQILVHYLGNDSSGINHNFLLEVFSQKGAQSGKMLSKKSLIPALSSTSMSSSNSSELVVRLYAETIEISNSTHELFASTNDKIATPCTISTSDKLIRLVVGKHSQLKY